MPVDQIPDARIRVTFRGFFIGHIEDGTYSAEIGALAPQISPCHQPRIHVYQTNTETEVTTEIASPRDLSRDFAVVAHKTSSKAIHVFWKDADDPKFIPFDKHNHPKDFRWFLNLNKVHDLPGTGANQVRIKGDRLKPVFRMNDGVFHTSDRSDLEARCQVLDSSGNPESEHAFGRFGQALTARVQLEGNDTADFTYGDGEIICTANSADVDDYIYDIEFDCRCFTHEEQSDFRLIYKVIELPLPMGKKKVDLIPDYHDNKLVSPEVYCDGGTWP